MCYFMVYIGDIALTGNNSSFVTKFFDMLANIFSIKDLGQLSHFLGIEIIPTKFGLFLSHHSHIWHILTHFKIDGAKEVIDPLSTSITLTKNDGAPKVDSTPYCKLVGTLQYLTFTRPDIYFAVNKLSQFVHSPSNVHWLALKRLLCYWKVTIHHVLFLYH